MKFLRIGELGEEVPVVSYGDVYHDIWSITADIDRSFLASNRVDATRRALAEHQLPTFGLKCDGARIGAPIARRAA